MLPSSGPGVVLLHSAAVAVPIPLASRAPPRRVLQALLRNHTQRAGQALSTDELAGYGWPGERPKPHAARSRVYLALNTLRSPGLSSVI